MGLLGACVVENIDLGEVNTGLDVDDADAGVLEMMWIGWMILMLAGVGDDDDMETGDTSNTPDPTDDGVTEKCDKDDLSPDTSSMLVTRSLLLRSGPDTVLMLAPGNLLTPVDPSLTSGTARRTGNFLPNLAGFFFFLLGVLNGFLSDDLSWKFLWCLSLADLETPGRNESEKV